MKIEPKSLLLGFLRNGLDPLSKLATIVAVVIAGIWTYHLHQITGESEINPEVSVSTEVFAYSQDARLLTVHVHEKNIGRVPVLLGSDALSLIVKRVPDGLKVGYVDMDKEPPTYEEKDIFKRYTDGVELGASSEFQDVSEFVVRPGLYHIEATLALPDGDTVNDATVQRVE
jgi:hypothetical protein